MRPQLRNACDFCHSKRIKCRSIDGSKCQQCSHRGIECKFSVKEKTGPKPKTLVKASSNSIEPTSINQAHSPMHLSENKSSFRINSNKNSRIAVSSYNSSSDAMKNLYSMEQDSGHMMNKCYQYNFSNMTSLSPLSQTHSSISCDTKDKWSPSSNVSLPVVSPFQLAKEWAYLRAYLSTTARLLRLSDSKALQISMSERKMVHTELSRRGDQTTSVDADNINLAELMATLSIGALVCNQNEMSEEYYDIACLFEAANQNDTEVAPLLCLLAFYCECRGNIRMKSSYLQKAVDKISIIEKKEVEALTSTIGLQVCIEHLNGSNGTNMWSPMYIMELPSNLGTLALVSSVLKDLPHILNPLQGYSLAASYYSRLDECIMIVNQEEGNELPILICRSLQTLLLTLLGHKKEAIFTISQISVTIDANPSIVRCMPLAWDLTLLAALIAYIFESKEEYTLLQRPIEWAQNTTVSTQWTCRLPSADCPLNLWLNHTCLRPRNISMKVCDVVRGIATKTKCGKASFYEIKKSMPKIENIAEVKMETEDSDAKNEFDENGLSKLDELARIAASYLSKPKDLAHSEESSSNGNKRKYNCIINSLDECHQNNVQIDQNNEEIMCSPNEKAKDEIEMNLCEEKVNESDMKSVKGDYSESLLSDDRKVLYRERSNHSDQSEDLMNNADGDGLLEGSEKIKGHFQPVAFKSEPIESKDCKNDFNQKVLCR